MEKRFLGLMQGIGDQVWQRPVVASVVHDLLERGIEPYASPSVPELWTDLQDYGLHLIKSDTELRTQRKHSESSACYDHTSWPRDLFDNVERDHDRYVIVPEYGEKEIRFEKKTIITALEESCGGVYDQNYMSIPDTPTFSREAIRGVVRTDKPIAVVRPVTIRKEWMAASRAPDPATIRWCSRILQKCGYYVISIADCDGDNEWIVGPEPYADLKLHAGELSIPQTIALIKHANIVVGGSGFIVPVCLATKTPLFLIFGGRGGYDSPFTLFDPRMDLRRIGWALPDNFCRCFEAAHPCDKKITDLDSQFYEFIRFQQLYGFL